VPAKRNSATARLRAELQRSRQLVVAFVDAAEAFHGHDGPKGGEEFDAKMKAWRKAYENIQRAAASYRQEGTNGAG